MESISYISPVAGRVSEPVFGVHHVCYMLVSMFRAQLDHCLTDLSLPALVLAGMGLLLSSFDR